MLNRPESFDLGSNAFIGITLKSSSNKCQMRIWYWLTDSNFANLNVYVRGLSSSQKSLIDSIKTSNLYWQRTDINIPDMAQFQVLITLFKNNYF
jgi:hypothetical protein